MLTLPADILTIIIDKSDILKPKLCIKCFRNFGLNYNCNHIDRSEIEMVVKFKLVCKHWNKAISQLLKNKRFKFMPYVPKFDYSRATVHLIELYHLKDFGNGEGDEEQEEEEKDEYTVRIQDLDVVNIDLLKKKFPYLIGRLRHGDIIENKAESGYRSQGVVMYFNDGNDEKLVNQNHDYDDYGSPSKCFELFDFPGGYWDKKYCDKGCGLNVNNEDNCSECTSDFYWHSDYGLAIIHRESLSNATPLGKKGKRHWWLVERNGRNYLISKNVKKNLDKYKETYAYCDGWSDDYQAYIIETYS